MESKGWFLALQILSCSDSEGLSIRRIVDAPQAGSKREGIEDGVIGPPGRFIKHHPEIIDITSYCAPDHNAGVIELLDREYEVLGNNLVIWMLLLTFFRALS